MLSALLCLLAIFAVGCTGGGGAVDRTMSGTSNLIVTVRAEPKSGWRDTSGQTSDYAPAQPGLGTAFKTLNYSSLDEIVVWVETATPVPVLPPPLNIDIAAPPLTEQVAAGGAVWQIRNTGGNPESLFIRTDEGHVQDLGKIAPGGMIDIAPPLSGSMELMADSREQPLARVFVAPSRTARLAKAGQKLTFNDLPPGPATVGCWHPRLPGSTVPVNLQPGQSSRVTLVVTVNQLPKVP